ncbi:hypothetical protein AVEN_138379-1 [Araneus ventricosus]|uniref:Uncharacterized protein n=1 Tax=Araneus ventricosus TaxID=182803 RepID=A0A4Y2QBG3_ARAVE|nr:hypothetical protein AVEN_138379-1 [Araneus ventricosus]
MGNVKNIEKNSHLDVRQRGSVVGSLGSPILAVPTGWLTVATAALIMQVEVAVLSQIRAARIQEETVSKAWLHTCCIDSSSLFSDRPSCLRNE